MQHKLDLLLGFWDILDFWGLVSLTSWTCWCHFIGKLAEQSHFKEPDFPACVSSPYNYFLKWEVVGGAGFPLQLCSAHWSPQAGVADGSLCLRLSQQDLPSKSIQGGTTWLLISGDENISGLQMTDCWWSIDRTDLEQWCLSRSQRVCNINFFYILWFVFFCFHLGFFVVVVFIVHSVQSKEGDLRYWS